jgi:hypothetical protein
MRLFFLNYVNISVRHLKFINGSEKNERVIGINNHCRGSQENVEKKSVDV